MWYVGKKEGLLGKTQVQDRGQQGFSSSLAQCQHFHPTPKSRESHPRRAMTLVRLGTDQVSTDHNYRAKQKELETTNISYYFTQDTTH